MKNSQQQKRNKKSVSVPDLVSKSNTMYLIILVVWLVSLVGLAINASSIYGMPNSVIL